MTDLEFENEMKEWEERAESQRVDWVLDNIRNLTDGYIRDLNLTCRNKASKFVLLNNKINEYNAVIQQYQKDISKLQTVIAEIFEKKEDGGFHERK
jgi:hypothetical protein